MQPLNPSIDIENTEAHKSRYQETPKHYRTASRPRDRSHVTTPQVTAPHSLRHVTARYKDRVTNAYCLSVPRERGTSRSVAQRADVSITKHEIVRQTIPTEWNRSRPSIALIVVRDRSTVTRHNLKQYTDDGLKIGKMAKYSSDSDSDRSSRHRRKHHRRSRFVLRNVISLNSSTLMDFCVQDRRVQVRATVQRIVKNQQNTASLNGVIGLDREVGIRRDHRGLINRLEEVPGTETGADISRADQSLTLPIGTRKNKDRCRGRSRRAGLVARSQT